MVSRQWFWYQLVDSPCPALMPWWFRVRMASLQYLLSEEHTTGRPQAQCAIRDCQPWRTPVVRPGRRRFASFALDSSARAARLQNRAPRQGRCEAANRFSRRACGSRVNSRSRARGGLSRTGGRSRRSVPQCSTTCCARCSAASGDPIISSRRATFASAAFCPTSLRCSLSSRRPALRRCS